MWLTENLREWDEETFAEERGMVWSDPTRPLAEQAAWLAAETVAWGLMDEPYLVDARLGAPSCQALAADFQELTGAFPDPRSCTEPRLASSGEVTGGQMRAVVPARS